MSENKQDSTVPAADERIQQLERIVDQLPEEFSGWRKIIEEATEQVLQVVGDKSEVAIIGPANAGKSTLYNKLIQKGQIEAAVSAVPGTTRQTQSADAGIFSVIDTPGADAVGEVGLNERQLALQAAEQADVLVVLFDASHGIRSPEKKLMAAIEQLRRPAVVGLNKIDLIPKRERGKVIGQAAETLGVPVERIVPVSAKEAEGLGRLLVGVAKEEPAILAALGAALPAYRWRLTQAVVARAASSSAVIAVTPLPFLDFLPLVGVQVAMVLSIARIYDFKLTLARARELLVTFGAGLLGRTLFYELSKLGGPPGWLVAAGVAVGTTSALGYASAVWFDRGTKLSGEALGRIGRAISRSVIDRLRALGEEQPERKTLRQRIDDILEESASTDLDYSDPSVSEGATEDGSDE